MAEERAVTPEAREALARVDDLRRRIDELDELLVRLLSARAACALEIGRQKKLLGLEIYQPSREAEVLAHVQRINPGPLNDASMKRLFERVIDEARRLEREAEPENGHERQRDMPAASGRRPVLRWGWSPSAREHVEFSSWARAHWPPAFSSAWGPAPTRRPASAGCHVKKERGARPWLLSCRSAPPTIRCRR